MDTEKQQHDPTMDDSTIIAEETSRNDQIPSWASVPKRKPVPLAKGLTASEPVNAGATRADHKRVWPFGLGGSRFRAQTRPHKFLIIAIAAVLLIALIIGLAVGLTVGKK